MVRNGNKAAQAAIAAPCKVSVRNGEIAGFSWNAMMKVIRYSASGSTHRNGAEATSVVM